MPSSIQKLQRTHIASLDTTLGEFAGLFWKRVHENEIRQRAYAVAFNFSLAIFPGVIFFFNLIPYFPIRHLEVRSLEFLDAILPKNVMHQIHDTIIDIVSHQKGGLLSLVFLITAYLSTNGVMALITAFNKIHHYPEKRSYLKQQLIATLLTMLLSFVIIACVTVLLGGKLALELMVEKGFLNKDSLYNDLSILRFVIVFLLFLLSTGMIYRIGPSVASRWNFFSTGALFSTIAIMLASIGFSFYIDFFGTYNKLYGSMGAMLGLMFWMFLVAFILLIGFQLNTIIDELNEQKAHKGRNTLE